MAHRMHKNWWLNVVCDGWKGFKCICTIHSFRQFNFWRLKRQKYGIFGKNIIKISNSTQVICRIIQSQFDRLTSSNLNGECYYKCWISICIDGECTDYVSLLNYILQLIYMYMYFGSMLTEKKEMTLYYHFLTQTHYHIPDSIVHGANMGPIWGRQEPGGPHVGPMNFTIWDGIDIFINRSSSGHLQHRPAPKVLQLLKYKTIIHITYPKPNLLTGFNPNKPRVELRMCVTLENGPMAKVFPTLMFLSNIVSHNKYSSWRCFTQKYCGGGCWFMSVSF